MARRRLVIVAAVLVTSVAVALIAWRAIGRPQPEPRPPAGMKYVGHDGVVFAVPESWVIVPPEPCHPSNTEPYVTFEASWIAFCPAVTGPQQPHVVIGRAWGGTSLRGLTFTGIVPTLRTLPDGWTTVPWAESEGSFLPEQDEVTEALNRAELEHRVEPVYDKKLIGGTVLELDPPMGSVIEDGGTVTLTVTTSDAAPRAEAWSSP